MDKLTGIIQMILPVVLMIAIGILCRKRSILTKQGIAGLKSLVVNITLPAVLLKAFYNAAYSLDMVIIAITMFLCCLAALGIGFLLKKLSRSAMHTLPFLMSGFEAGMLGYALYTLLFGSANIPLFATVDLGQVLFVFTVYLSLLNPAKEKGGAVKAAILNIVKSPVILSIAAGILLGTTGLGRLLSESAAGDLVQGTLEFISAPTAVLILLVVGYELEFKTLNLKATLSTVLTRFLLMGVLCLLVLTGLSAFITVSEHLKWAFILLFLLPPPYVIPIFVRGEKENAYLSATLSLSTLVSLGLFAIIALVVA